MQDKQKLEDAVARKIITQEQADALAQLDGDANLDAVLNENSEPKLTGEDAPENFRLIGGFGDIFVAIGILFFMIGLRFLFAFLLPDFTGNGQASVDLAMVAVALILAEWITRRRRMKLPSLVLGAMFLWYLMDLIIVALSHSFGFSLSFSIFSLFAAGENISIVSILYFAGIFIGAALYFIRYRLPFMAAPMAASSVGILAVALGTIATKLFSLDDLAGFEGASPLEILRQFIYFPLFCGLGIFAIALLCDLKDRHRVSTWSDSAFWLHLISAPLIVHTLYVLVAGTNTQLGRIEGGSDGTWVMIALVLLFTFTSLCIDRRALLIPSLGYFGGLGIYKLFGSDVVQQSGVPSFAILLLIVGLLVIVFGTGWHKIRRFVANAFLPKSWLEHLPPIESNGK